MRKQADRELARLEKLPQAAAEHGVIRTYLEWIASLPWDKSTEDNLDLAHAREVLDDDHYDLEKVKDRILEYLAVRTLKPDARGSILCFVGPPGVGKTSLGHSIARALGRKFVRISAGGVRDEAEIRGHRRTYIGAMPGRSSARCATRARATRCSCSTRSTRWAPTSAATRRSACSRCSTRSRTRPSATTTSTCRSTCRG